MRITPLSSVLCLLSSIALAVGSAFAEVPVSINYTGHIEGADGKALKSNVMLMAFRLYGTPGTGRTAEKATALWGRKASVSLTDGNFDVDLKDTFGATLADTRYASLAEAIAAAIGDGSGDLYLGLTPASDSNAEIYPRQRLTAVVKAVQARAVRTIAEDFVATNGTFTTDGPVTVTGASVLRGDVTYGATDFGVGSTVSFPGGISVSGTLRANSVSASTIDAETVAVANASTTGTGALSVTGTLASAGTVVWSGDITQSAAGSESVGTVAAKTVVGNVTASDVTNTTLTAENFVNRSTTFSFCDHCAPARGASWRWARSWETVPEVTEVAERFQMTVYDPQHATRVSRQSISAGAWQAPYDCLALFQTSIYNNQENDVACIQFYILSDPRHRDFEGVSPNAVATVSGRSGDGSKIRSVVPLLLRKGQIVKWLNYNNNKAPGTSIEETDETKVDSISYLPFGWSE